MRNSLFLVITLFVITVSPALGVEFSATMITQIMGQFSGKFYFKDADTYRTEAIGIINIVKAQMVYQIVPEKKKYVVQKIDEFSKDNPMGHYGDAMAYIKKHNMKQSGKETIQGYKCTVYEGSISTAEGQPANPTKLWYSKELNNTIKQEINIGPPMGNMVMALENIKTGKLDKSLFELPKGYTQVDNIGEALGINVSKNPALGGEKGKGPSPDEMKKILEQLQKQ